MQRIFPSRRILAGLAVSVWLVFASLAPAATTALIMGGTGSPLPNPGYVNGYLFSVIESYISVTALGFYDFGGDGLLSSHQVGLWDANGVLLGSVEIPAGTGAYLENDFRWVNLPTPIFIPTGYFTVAGTDGDDPIATDYTREMAPGITYVDGVWVESGTLTYPTGSQPTAGLGGNFKYDNVPEPSTWALVVLCGLGVLVARRWRMGVAR